MINLYKRADFISALFRALSVITFISAILPISGCVSGFLDDREGYANKLAATKGWVPRDIQTQSFTLRAYGPTTNLPKRVETLTVYVEGDGLAWTTRNTPAMDPTPDDPIALKLALGDGNGPVVYLARPCQYTIDLDRHLCRTTHWTLARYSEQIVQSMNEGLSKLKISYNANRIRLVGYSGGGTIAALLAARRNDIVELMTIAANLDTDYWTRLHGVTPLRGSLNPAKLMNLANVPQTHFVGAEDDIVPRAVVESYLRSIGVQSLDTLHVIANVDHQCCWSEIWPDLYKKWKYPK